MDFAALPPEVNSGRMYAGPGSGTMFAASAAWERLAAELSSSATAYDSVIAELTGREWLGPAAASMAAAAAPYAVWMRTTGAQAEQAAVQAASAASAFEEAYAAVVPPPVIAANRTQLATLMASNGFGQNSTGIAATEAEYAEMWVQDAVAMYGYGARSAAAASVTPFSQPPATTSAAGLGGQAAAVAQAAGGGAHSQLSQLMAAISQVLHGAAPPAGSPAPLADSLAPLQSTPTPPLSQLASYVETVSRTILPANDSNVSALYGMGQYTRNLNTDLDMAAAAGGRASAPPPATALDTATRAMASPGPARLGGTGSPVSAGVGNAGTVGKLTVPPGWVETMPDIQMTATALPDTALAAAPTAAADGPTDLFADMTVAGLAGRAIAGGAAPGVKGRAQNRLERLAGELTGAHEVQHWHTDRGRLKSLLDELSRKPGVHEVYFNRDGQTPDQPRPPQSQG